jgi:hypothetical protein
MTAAARRRALLVGLVALGLAPHAAAQEQPVKPDEIRIVTTTTVFQVTAQGPYPFMQKSSTTAPTDKLADEFGAFIEKVGRALQKAPSSLGAYTLDEIEVHAEVNAQGGVSLIGTATVGASGGITVKFKRQAPPLGSRTP